jgi:hypothetical protein
MVNNRNIHDFFTTVIKQEKDAKSFDLKKLLENIVPKEKVTILYEYIKGT